MYVKCVCAIQQKIPEIYLKIATRKYVIEKHDFKFILGPRVPSRFNRQSERVLFMLRQPPPLPAQ